MTLPSLHELPFSGSSPPAAKAHKYTPHGMWVRSDSQALARGPFITDSDSTAKSIEDVVDAIAAQIGSNSNLETGHRWLSSKKNLPALASSDVG